MLFLSILHQSHPKKDKNLKKWKRIIFLNSFQKCFWNKRVIRDNESHIQKANLFCFSIDFWKLTILIYFKSNFVSSNYKNFWIFSLILISMFIWAFLLIFDIILGPNLTPSLSMIISTLLFGEKFPTDDSNLLLDNVPK